MSSDIEVVKLSRSTRDVRRFLQVAYWVYREDPLWVAPLLFDLEKVFLDANPFFEHAQIELWVARKGGIDVGRIAAVLDRGYNQTAEQIEIFYGFFECIQDAEVSKRLFETVFQWGRERGAKRVLGPMNPSTNDECGLLVKGFDSSPVFMMTYNPEYYVALVEAAGFVKEKDLIAYHMDLSKSPLDRLQKIAAKTRKRYPELTFSPVRKKTLEQDLDKIKVVYNAAWEKNWGFVPMTDHEINFMAERLKTLLMEGIVWLAEAPTGPVGFLLALPDYNEGIKPLYGRLLTPRLLGFIPYAMGWKIPKMVRVITLGVVEGYRNRGIEAVMLAEGLKVGERVGFTHCEASWVLEDNLLMKRLIELFGGEAYKTYRLLSRPL
jgi:hypothetical protein